MSDVPETPNLDKLISHEVEITYILEFLEWCEDIAKVGLYYDMPHEGFMSQNGIDLIHQWLGIDSSKVQEERKAILEMVREQQNT